MPERAFQHKNASQYISPEICRQLWCTVLLHAMKGAVWRVVKRNGKKKRIRNESDFRWVMSDHLGAKEICNVIGVDVKHVRKAVLNGRQIKLLEPK